MLISIIQAEHVKTMRTFIRKLVWFLPVLAAALALFLLGGIPNAIPASAWNNWYAYLLPTALALICSLSITKEKKTKYYNLNTLSTPISALLMGKIGYIALLLLLSNGSMIICTSVIRILVGISMPVSRMFAAALLLTITYLWEIPFYLFLSAKFGLFTSLLTSLFVSITGTAFFSTAHYWWICPAAIPVRLMCPVLGILPNGIVLTNEQHLLGTHIIPLGIIISLLWFLLLTFLLVIWFRKTEVK